VCDPYFGSAKATPSLAFTIANLIPSALTRGQSIRSWWLEMSMPLITPPTLRDPDPPIRA